ncbi:MAG: AmmeMemoRadiSam system protein B [Candidatus Omnitrophica bacterium]|nr:AmmeMemoRadiSam system protein B [Candidatus Omnitrophota bacterium]
MPDIRTPVVAGQFYPASAQSLKEDIASLIDNKAEKKDCLACMLPHAGYVYSGKVAAETVSHVRIKDNVLLLGPNHTGRGADFSIMTKGSWQTPLGKVEINSTLAQDILQSSKHLKSDSVAHAQEHSLEVELPFLQYFKTDFKIIPIAFMSQDIAALKETGREIADVILRKNIKKETLIIASSDMTHYEPQNIAQKKDQQAIQAIIELNEDKLVEKVGEFEISMCGIYPAIVMLSAVRALGAKNAKLIKYQTSADATGDKNSVVGYAGIIIY